MLIIGAGLTGLLAGALNQTFQIYEAQEIVQPHRAVLRFRTDRIGKILGIKFRQVRVQKAICDNRDMRNWCSPRDAINYSRKVGALGTARSILDLSPADRFIAPENFQEILTDLCASRINYGHRLDTLDRDHATFQVLSGFIQIGRAGGYGVPLISTIPIRALSNALGYNLAEHCRSADITVTRFRVKDARFYGTVYFPSPEVSLYRASMTGDLLIIESMFALNDYERHAALHAFGLEPREVEVIDTGTKPLGKIVPLPDEVRKQTLHHFSSVFNVWSLGRYACWRNILLDDVLDDMFKIREMAGLSVYDMARNAI